MEFSPTYQIDLLTRVTDKTWMEQSGSLLAPSMFDPELQPIAKEVCRAWQKGQTLTAGQLSQLALRHKIKLELKTKVKYDPTFDRQQVKDFAQYQTLKDAFVEARTHLESGGYQRAIACVTEAAKGLPGASESAITNILIGDRPLPQREKLCPTGLGALDTSLKGGIGAGELAVVMAPTSGGKTSFLIQVAAVAAEHGKKVFYVTTECPSYEIEGKLRARLCQKPDATPKEWKAKTLALNKKGARLDIVEHGEGAVSVLDIDTECPRDTDLLIVDNADDLLNPSYSGSGIEHVDLGNIYNSLKGIGLSRRIPVWSVSQVNRQNYEADVIYAQAIASSLRKAWKADTVLTINQTAEEAKVDPKNGCCTATIFGAKFRQGVRFFRVETTVNFGLNLFSDGKWA